LYNNHKTQARTHKHSHAHTQDFLCPPPPFFLSFSPPTLSFPLPPSLFNSPSLSLSFRLFPCLSLSHTHMHKHKNTHTQYRRVENMNTKLSTTALECLHSQPKIGLDLLVVGWDVLKNVFLHMLRASRAHLNMDINTIVKKTD